MTSTAALRRALLAGAAGLAPLLAAAQPAGAQSSGAQSSGGSYVLSKVTFQGNQQVPTSELQAALPVQVGQQIDHAGLQADADAVGAVYQKHNVGADITTRMTILHKTRAEITYVLAEKAPVAPTVTHVAPIADKVSVTGNSRIATDKILAAAAIRPGDAVTNEKVTAAQNAVVGLYKKANIGSTVSIDWTNVSPTHIDMVVKVVEKPDE